MIGLCHFEGEDWELAEYSFRQCLDIAEDIFVVVSKEVDANLTDRDSVFDSLDLEREQYSFLNFQLGKLYYDSDRLRNYDKADMHLQEALKYILLVRGDRSR